MTQQHTHEPAKLSRQLVERYLNKLSAQDPSLYYTNTSEVARRIHTLLKEQSNQLSVEEQHVVRDLSVEEVAMILGFHSS